MKRFKCVCGNDSFKANPDCNMIQCWDCRQRYLWKGTWKKVTDEEKDNLEDWKQEAWENSLDYKLLMRGR